jgi:hypothetical protein
VLRWTRDANLLAQFGEVPFENSAFGHLFAGYDAIVVVNYAISAPSGWRRNVVVRMSRCGDILGSNGGDYPGTAGGQ